MTRANDSRHRRAKSLNWPVSNKVCSSLNRARFSSLVFHCQVPRTIQDLSYLHRPFMEPKASSWPIHSGIVKTSSLMATDNDQTALIYSHPVCPTPNQVDLFRSLKSKQWIRFLRPELLIFQIRDRISSYQIELRPNFLQSQTKCWPKQKTTLQASNSRCR